MKHLLFIEQRRDAAWAREHWADLSQAKLIAVTSEALVALEEAGLPYSPAAEYTDLHLLAAADDQLNRDCLELTRRIDQFVGSRLPRARFEGPGPLTGNVYYLQYSVSAIVKRALIYRDAITAHEPGSVTVFEAPPCTWFAVDGYLRDPWMDWLQTYAKAYPIQFRRIAPRRTDTGLLRSILRKALNGGQFLRYGITRRLFRTEASISRGPHNPSEDLDGLRLLFIDSVAYDWGPVVRHLSTEQQVSCFALDSREVTPDQFWSTIHSPSIRHLGTNVRLETGLSDPLPDQAEAGELNLLLQEWLETTEPHLDVLGIDVLPHLIPQLREMLCQTPALLRYTDALARAALEKIQPHAVCFVALCNFASQRIAQICRERGVPVVCYQHGFGYAVNTQPKDEITEPAHADYFLTYGKSIQPRDHPVVPTRARFIPVGSARIEALSAGRRTHPKTPAGLLKILWIAEYANANTWNATLTEDTRRFIFYRQCFKLFATDSRLRVTYRPYRSAPDGFVDWLDRQKLPNVRTNAYQPLNELIETSDVAVVTTSSPTVWGEVVGLKTPMILYCDPDQTPLMPYFTRDLETACHWCRTPDELIRAITRLVMETENFVDELRAKDTDAFIRDYLLHDGNCAGNAISFLSGIRGHDRRVEVANQ